MQKAEAARDKAKGAGEGHAAHAEARAQGAGQGAMKHAKTVREARTAQGDVEKARLIAERLSDSGAAHSAA